MGSRIREDPPHVFECFCEISVPTSSSEVASIRQSYPENYPEEGILKSVPEFAFPCTFNNNHVQHFSFVLTNIDSKWTFGYCRHAPDIPTYVFLSSLPWHETFYTLLNFMSEITSTNENAIWMFLEALYHAPVPVPGHTLRVLWNSNQKLFMTHCPDHRKLPSIPENRNLMEYVSAVDVHSMMVLFASTLHERRVIITSKRLSRLTACVQAVNALLYPMQWQHIFIPVLPGSLLDYLSAPMPFLIGVPSITISQVDPSDLEEVVFLDADTNDINTPFDDLQKLPGEVVALLKKNLKNPNAMLGDGIPRAFLHATVQLIGGYRDALRLKLGEKISFDPEKFIQSRSSSMQKLLEKILNLQLFQQFIEGRLELLNCGKGFRDEFEFEVNSYEDKSNSGLTTQYKEWLHTMKKGSSTFLKSVKSKFKDRSKQAYKDVRLKANDKKQQDITTVRCQDNTQPRSAPSSPTLRRNRHSSKVKCSTKSRFSITKSVSPRTAEETCSSTRSQPIKLLDAKQDMKGTENLVSVNAPSPSPSLQKINMDLMGDLQDLIFTQCAHGSLDSIAASSATSNSTSVDQVQSSGSVETFSLELLSSQDDLLLHDNKPIPPPRFKRKNKSTLSSLRLVNPDKQVELSTTYESTTELSKSSVEPTANSQVLLDIINEKLSCPTTCPTGQKATPGLLDNSAIPEHSTEIDDSSYPGGESVSLSTSPFFTPSPLNDLELLKKYGLKFTSLRVKSPGLSSRSSSITDTSSTSNSSKPLPQQTTQK